MRASVISQTLDTSGSVYLMIDVPSPAEGTVVLSGVALDRAAESDTRVAASRRPAGLGLPFSPTLDRVFTAGDAVRVSFHVRRRNAREAVEGRASVADESGTVVTSVPWSLAPSAAPAVTLTLPLAGTAPGICRLVVSAAGGQGAAVDREVGIRIR